MRLTQNINGKRTEMSAEKDAETRAGWANNELKERTRVPEPTVEERFAGVQERLDKLEGNK